MSKITLRPIATTDLYVTYARVMEPGKIRHYRVPYSEQLMYTTEALERTRKDLEAREYQRLYDEAVKAGKLAEFGENPPKVKVEEPIAKTPKDLIREHILAEEPNAEIEFLEGVTSLQPNSPLTLTEANLLENDPEIEAALKKVQVKSVLYQYNEITFSPNKAQKVLGYLTRAINRFIIFPINRLIYKLRINDFDWTYQPDFAPYSASIEAQDVENFQKHLAKKSAFRRFVARIPQITPLNPMEETYVRKVVPAQYLTVAYEEGNEAKAKEIILDDLRKIHSKGLIMGSFLMPKIIMLADVIGNGLHKAVIFLSLFVDYEKMMKEHGLSLTKMPPQPLKTLYGIKTDTIEGGITTFDELQSKNEIEEVIVNPISKAKREEYVREAEERLALAAALKAGKAE